MGPSIVVLVVVLRSTDFHQDYSGAKVCTRVVDSLPLECAAPFAE